MDSTSGDGRSLGGWIEDTHQRWLKNRRKLTVKWTRNLAAYAGDTSHPAWARSPKAADWQSAAFYRLSKQKVLALLGALCDVVLSGARLAFMLKLDQGAAATSGGEPGAPDVSAAAAGPVGAPPPLIDATPGGEAGPPPAAGTERDALAQAIFEHEEQIHSQMDACHGLDQVSAGLCHGLMFGLGWLKRVGDAVVRVSPFDMTWDMEAEDFYRDSDGVCHTVRLSRPALYAAFASDSLTDQRALREILERGTDERSTSGDGTAAGQGEDARPAAMTVARSNRTVDVREYWGMVPEACVEDFERQIRQSRPAAGEAPAPPEAPENAAVDVGGAPARSEAPANAPAGAGAAPGGAQEWGKPFRMVEVAAWAADRKCFRMVRTERADRPLYPTWIEMREPGLCEGVADNVECEQEIVNTTLRGIADNTRLVTTLIAAVKRRFLPNLPADGSISPGTLLDVSEDCDDARRAFQQVKLDDTTDGAHRLLGVILSMADLSSMVPRIQQGQQEGSDQTAFELRSRLEQAGKYAAQIVRAHDTTVQVLVLALFRRNLRLAIERAEKVGDSERLALLLALREAKVKALGFTSFQNRTVRARELTETMAMALGDQELRAMSKVRWLYTEILKSRDIAPEQVIKSPRDMTQEADEREELLATQTAAGAGGAATERELAEIARLRAEARRSDALAEKVETDVVIAKARAVSEAQGGVAPALAAGGPAASGEA
jgi:hypothetical protein